MNETTHVQQTEGKLASALEKTSKVLDSASAGISQRPTAWTAVLITSAFCARDGLVLWFYSGRMSAIIQAMCGTGYGTP